MPTNQELCYNDMDSMHGSVTFQMSSVELCADRQFQTQNVN